MATPANLTFTDIETRCMNELRLNTANTVDKAKVDAVINMVYRDIYVKCDWWFLRKRAITNTLAKYTTGTILVTNGSTSVTLSSAPAVGLGSFAGGKLTVIGDTNDNSAVYRISSHTAGTTAITLDAAFTGADSTAATYRIYFDEYTLSSDVGKILKATVFGQTLNMERVSFEDMANLKSSGDMTEGKPRCFTVNDFETTGDPTTARRIIFWPYPDKTYRIEISYKQQLNTELSGTTQPLIPDEYRQILIYGTLARGYPIFMADSERGQVYQAVFNDMLNLMTANHREYAQERPQMAPWDQDRQRYSARRRMGRVSLGNFFDTYPRDPW
jgi:hypothetical protein